MAVVAFLALAQRIINDSAYASISVVDLIEQANFPASAFSHDGVSINWMPVQPYIQVFVIFDWPEDGKDEATVSQQIITAGGKLVPLPFLQPFHIERTLAPAVGWPRGRSLWALERAPIDVPGRYVFQLVVDGEVAASHPVTVASLPPPPDAGGE